MLETFQGATIADTHENLERKGSAFRAARIADILSAGDEPFRLAGPAMLESIATCRLKAGVTRGTNH